MKYLANMLIHSHSYPSPWLCWHFIFFLGGLRWGIWGSFNLKEKNREHHLSMFTVWCALTLKMTRWAKQSILLPVYWGEKHRHKKYNGLSKITGRWRPVTQTLTLHPVISTDACIETQVNRRHSSRLKLRHSFQTLIKAFVCFSARCSSVLCPPRASYETTPIQLFSWSLRFQASSGITLWGQSEWLFKRLNFL